MKMLRHTVNVPGEMEPLLSKRIEDFKSPSGYFVSLGTTGLEAQAAQIQKMSADVRVTKSRPQLVAETQ